MDVLVKPNPGDTSSSLLMVWVIATARESTIET